VRATVSSFGFLETVAVGLDVDHLGAVDEAVDKRDDAERNNILNSI
jgi:hypothetical protein